MTNFSVKPPKEWLDGLCAYAIKKYGFDEQTAKEYRDDGEWGDYFADGYTPEEALDEDASYWTEDDVGDDYKGADFD